MIQIGYITIIRNCRRRKREIAMAHNRFDDDEDDFDFHQKNRKKSRRDKLPNQGGRINTRFDDEIFDEYKEDIRVDQRKNTR